MNCMMSLGNMSDSDRGFAYIYGGGGVVVVVGGKKRFGGETGLQRD